MAFSDAELKHIDRNVGRFCRRRSRAPSFAAARLEYEVTGHRVIVVETRAGPGAPSAPGSRHPVAKFTFVRKSAIWRLFWPRTPLRWNSYTPLPSSPELAALVSEVGRDPHCCFFD